MISIILPVYNAEDTVKETINSIYAQSFKDWELIIINDQSTDETQKILDTYRHTQNGANRLPIYLNTDDIHEKGIVAALNFGISKASGEYIARMDADDIMKPDRLELQEYVMRTNPEINLIAGNAEIIGYNIKNAGLISTDSLSALDERCCIVHPTVMWRKEYFDKHNLIYRKEYEYTEDYDLWMRYRKTPQPTYARINKVLIDYRVSTKSISSNKSNIQKELLRKLYKEYNIPPYLSVIDLENRDCDEFIKILDNQKYVNYEVVSSLKEAKGKMIAFSKFEDDPNRFDRQVSFLNNRKDYIGAGTYIQKKEGTFFYTPEYNLIEKELLRGHTVIEPGTFMFKNNPKAYSKLDKNIDFFQLYCNLLKYGKLTNIQQPLVKTETYESIKNEHLVDKIKYAQKQYDSIINTIQINITSEGNFSGVDRYLDTLENNLPENFRTTRITFIASDRIEWRINQKHILIYYNPGQTKLESMFDMFWDNLNQLFLFRPNLIVQSNCLNLYSLVNFLRRKVRLVHVCMMHCVPYREAIRFDRNKYEELEKLYYDDSQDFVDTPDHQLPLILADYVILNTKDAEDYYIRCGYLTPYTVISNGIDLINGEPKQPVGEKFKFIFVGHSSPLKGFDQLIPIIEEVSKKYPIEVLWAGSADKETQQIIAKKKLPIKVYGVIPPSQLNGLYREADAALIATACETCSYAAIEALSAGLPIIATNAHGVHEIVEGVGYEISLNQKGIIDKNAYLAAMEKIITDADIRKQLSEKSRARYKLYTAEKMVTKTANFYKSIIV
jgi:glycosyltransferase involved in cell wall biosynthesis